MKKIIFFISLMLGMSSALSAQENSVLRLNATLQGYSPGQPWNKSEPTSLSGLVTYLGDGKLIVTAALIANSVYLELETVDGSHRIPAKVRTVDYKANLALIEPLTDEGKDYLEKNFEAVEIGKPCKIGDTLQVLQFEGSGRALKTEGEFNAAKLTSGLVPGNFFLHYFVKASMQSAASSISIPVFKGNKLISLVVRYTSSEQKVEAIAPEVITAFLENAEDGEYSGFPSLGLVTAKTSDPHFRKWLKLNDDKGGLYITRVIRGSSAESLDFKKGDVLLSINGINIDRSGYFESNNYGKIHWGHLVRTEKKIGEKLDVTILREGKEETRSVELKATNEGLIQSHSFDKAPSYLVKAGLIFQELDSSYLRLYGENWLSRAPVGLLDVYNHPEDYEEGRNRVVFLSGVIPTPATLGYEKLRALVITSVNGEKIADIPSLIKAFDKAENGIHTIEFLEQPRKIYLSAPIADEVDKSLIQRGLPTLSRQ